MIPDNIDYDSLKKRGFLRQGQDGFFVLRTRMSKGVYTKEQLLLLSRIAQVYAGGFVHATTRQGLEIPFIRFDDINTVEKKRRDIQIELNRS